MKKNTKMDAMYSFRSGELAAGLRLGSLQPPAW